MSLIVVRFSACVLGEIFQLQSGSPNWASGNTTRCHSRCGLAGICSSARPLVCLFVVGGRRAHTLGRVTFLVCVAFAGWFTRIIRSLCFRSALLACVTATATATGRQPAAGSTITPTRRLQLRQPLFARWLRYFMVQLEFIIFALSLLVTWPAKAGKQEISERPQNDAAANC